MELSAKTLPITGDKFPYETSKRIGLCTTMLSRIPSSSNFYRRFNPRRHITLYSGGSNLSPFQIVKPCKNGGLRLALSVGRCMPLLVRKRERYDARCARYLFWFEGVVKRRVDINLVAASVVFAMFTGCATTSRPTSTLSAEDKAVELVMGSLTKDEAVDCSLTVTILQKLQETGVISSNVETSYFTKSSRAFVTRMTNAVESEEGFSGLLDIALKKNKDFLNTPYATRLGNETNLPAKTVMLRSKFESCEPFSSKYLGVDDVRIDWSGAEVAR